MKDKTTFGNPKYKYFMAVQNKCHNCSFDMTKKGRPWILRNDETGEFTAYCPVCETELKMTIYKGSMKDFTKKTLEEG